MGFTSSRQGFGFLEPPGQDVLGTPHLGLHQVQKANCDPTKLRAEGKLRPADEQGKTRSDQISKGTATPTPVARVCLFPRHIPLGVTKYRGKSMVGRVSSTTRQPLVFRTSVSRSSDVYGSRLSIINNDFHFSHVDFTPPAPGELGPRTAPGKVACRNPTAETGGNG